MHLKKLKKKSRGLPKFTYLGCTETKNRTPWCFRICQPDKQGHGKCGRYAPHAVKKGHLQQTIIDYDNKKKLEKIKIKKQVRKIKGLPKYTFLGCPLTKNKTPWCFRICKPDSRNQGKCGRIAPHTIKGHLQQSIIDHEKRNMNNATEEKE